MSNLFEEFSENEPEYIDFGRIETEDQAELRERFALLTEQNIDEIQRFDPTVFQASYFALHPSEKDDLDEREPQLARALTENMVRASGLEMPTDAKSPLLLMNQPFKNGAHVAVFAIEREDGVLVPLYFETNSTGTPEMVCLMSYDRLKETLVHYKELASCRAKLEAALGMEVGAVDHVRAEDLKSLLATLDSIEDL